jgi:nitroreductase
MILTPETFAALVAEANLAPSVHNTQPTRWRLETDGSVSVIEEIDRRLAVGDPMGRDADVSHGAAIEGFSLAASAHGWTVKVEPLQSPAAHGLRDVARLNLGSPGEADALQAYVAERQSYRGAYMAGEVSNLAALEAVGDVRLATTAQEIGRLAELNDQASLRTFRNSAFRAELLSWMRLSRRDPRWPHDGLNADALSMSGLESFGAGLVLKPGLFEALDRLGLAAALVAEAKVVRTARAIALFHRPEGEPPLETGRRFYRLWLEFARLGLSAAPMSVLADDPQIRAIVADAFGLASDRRLITAFRLGVGPLRAPVRARLPVSELTR